MSQSTKPIDVSYASPESIERLRGQLTDILGAEHVIADETEREFYSQDVYMAGELVALVIRPGTIDELSKSVAAITSAGFPVAPRGGGMSYTSGYIQKVPSAVLVDMARLNKVKEINTDDMYVTVEANCTWAELNDALMDTGLRTPMWGTLSGLRATVGGGLSQNCLFFGSGHHGTAADSVIGLKVVLADGSVVPTGTLSTKGGKPFMRYYGPDLTGIFLADTGALGFKAEITLRLIQRLPHEAYASFAFDTPDACADALSAIARTGIPSELFGFDPNLAEMRLKRDSLINDLQRLKGVVSKAGVKEAAKVALAGRRYMDDVAYSIHAVVEGRHKSAVDADLEEVRKIAKQQGGREIENSMPKIMRGIPFVPLNSMLGPEGERWAPIHGLVAHSDAKKTWKAIYDLFDEFKDKMDDHGITYGFLVGTISTNGFIIEPVLYWPDKRMAIHERTVEDNLLKTMKDFEPNPACTDVVHELKRRLCQLFLDHSAAHLQIGKTYLYKEGRDPETWKLVEGIKDLVDPNRRVNPGSLGLD